MIKVLVVDDSAFMRQELSRIISSDPNIKVVGTATDGEDALLKIDSLCPDVVTLDIEMPKMDGLTALKHIMIMKPMPVVMISSLTQKGADKTFEALQIGAIECIAKPSGTISLGVSRQSTEIISKIKAASLVDCSRIRKMSTPIPPPQTHTKNKINATTICKHIVAIGVSTGGPHTLMNIIPKLSADLPAGVLIVQHMPPVFTKNFAERLNNVSAITVKEAQDNDPIIAGHAYVAPGDFHMVINSCTTKIKITKVPEDTLHRPAVDVMMHSVADNFKGTITGVILTGMGKDGAMGLKHIRDKGFRTIGESEKTAVVYGMPREAFHIGGVEFVLDNDKIADKIMELVRIRTSV